MYGLSMSTITLILFFGAVLGLFLLYVFGVLYFYVSAKGNMSFVRTGIGGARAIVDGGTLVLPWLHKVIKVNHEVFHFESEDSLMRPFITSDGQSFKVWLFYYLYVPKDVDKVLAVASHLKEDEDYKPIASCLYGSEFSRVVREVIKEHSQKSILDNPEKIASLIRERINEECKGLFIGHVLHSLEITSIESC